MLRMTAYSRHMHLFIFILLLNSLCSFGFRPSLHHRQPPKPSSMTMQESFNIWHQHLKKCQYIISKAVISCIAASSLLQAPSASLADTAFPSTSTLSQVESNSINLDDPKLTKGLINFYPSDDFWYPPYLVGRWKATFTFDGASFDQALSEKEFEAAAESGLIPGFKKYSVAFLPNIGKDVECTIRYVQLDSHPREDHPFNTRQLISAFVPDAVVDSAPYSFQRSPNWFDIPANDRTIKYHDNEGSGTIDIHTIKRSIFETAGAVQTVELFQQVSNFY
jgi:hypothetical protein